MWGEKEMDAKPFPICVTDIVSWTMGRQWFFALLIRVGNEINVEMVSSQKRLGTESFQPGVDLL